MDVSFTSTDAFQIIILCSRTVSVSLKLLGGRGLHYRSSVEAVITIQIFFFIFEGKIDKIYFPFNLKEEFYRDEVKTGLGILGYLKTDIN